MTLALLEILLGLMLAYCSLICVQLVPALIGKSRPGHHCSGSLLALLIGTISYFIAAILSGALSGILGAAILGRLFGGGGGPVVVPGGGGGGETPAPVEPAPTPEPAPVPEIPPAIGIDYITRGQQAVAAGRGLV